MKDTRNVIHRVIIGIDEAGRGPLAGPLVVAGIKVPVTIFNFKFSIFKSSGVFKGIKDSKKLTAKKREDWFKILTSHPKIKWAVARVRPKTIDRINIAVAANLGAQRVYWKLAGGTFYPAVLDGSLYLSRGIPHRTIIKGDEKIPVISAASIIAKVTRDRIMARLHKKYPQYGFDVHKGYGTKRHREIIKKIGGSVVHRKSFQCGLPFSAKPVILKNGIS